MQNFIIATVLIIVLAAACVYVIKSKKQGAKCIGCPMAKNCNSCKCDNDK